MPASQDLPGYHPELVRGALDAGESIECLVYAPLYEASGGPFGVSGTSGSHAVAVTPSRIVVSRDPHSSEPRSVRSVPLDRVLWIEVGEALVLGWFVVRFWEGGEIQSETVFFQSSGRRHFEAAVRAVRNRVAIVSTGRPAEVPEWRGVESASPPYLRGELGGLVLGRERPLAVLRSTERWETNRIGRHRFRRCLSPSALAVLSDRAIFLVESEQPPRPGGLVFGVNTTVVERPAVRGCRVERHGAETSPARLLVDIGAEGCIKPLAVPFDDEYEAAARSVAEALCARPAAS